jgi:hypothetical protein
MNVNFGNRNLQLQEKIGSAVNSRGHIGLSYLDRLASLAMEQVLARMPLQFLIFQLSST